jgi:hypothetical protein
MAAPAKFDWSSFLKGLAAAGIGGAVSFGGQAASTGVINKSTGVTAGVGALLTVGAYLLQSPLLQPKSPSEN